MASDLIVNRDGRWVLASNDLPVSYVRAWGSASIVNREYIHRPPTSADEYAAALAWTFPAIHETATINREGTGTCRCGEWLGSDHGGVTTCADCGRRYRVRLEEVTTVDPVCPRCGDRTYVSPRTGRTCVDDACGWRERE